MTNKDLSLLQNFQESCFYNDPFPHLIIHKALPDEIYEKIKKSVPINMVKDRSQNNMRGNIFPDEFENKLQNKFFFDFLNYNRSEEFYTEAIKIFESKINKFYQGIINKVNECFKTKKILNVDSNNLKNLKNLKKNFISLESTYSYNTPTLETSSVRGPHLDHYDKIFFGLFYLRDENDYSEGGDLVLYKWKNSYNNFKKKNIIFTEKWKKTLLHSEPVKTLKYKKNTFILALNSINSLHGVSPKNKSNSIRQFCYFTIRNSKDLGFATPSLFDKLLFSNISLKDKFLIIMSSLKFWSKYFMKYIKIAK